MFFHVSCCSYKKPITHRLRAGVFFFVKRSSHVFWGYTEARVKKQRNRLSRRWTKTKIFPSERAAWLSLGCSLRVVRQNAETLLSSFWSLEAAHQNAFFCFSLFIFFFLSRRCFLLVGFFFCACRSSAFRGLPLRLSVSQSNTHTQTSLFIPGGRTVCAAIHPLVVPTERTSSENQLQEEMQAAPKDKTPPFL